MSSFPSEPWFVTETEYVRDDLERNASLFFLGNGYLGVRGSFEEGSRSSRKGTFVNGFYESGPQVYGESAFGFPDKKQAMLSLPDPTSVRIFLDDEEFSSDSGLFLEYRRSLSLKEGLLRRNLLWESPKGRRMKLEFTRCVSVRRSHLAVISCRISGLEGVAELRVESGCAVGTVNHSSDKSDPRTGAGFDHSPLEMVERQVERDRIAVRQRTVNSGLEFGESVSNAHGGGLSLAGTAESDSEIVLTYTGSPSGPGDVFQLDKYISFYTSIESEPDELVKLAKAETAAAERAGLRTVIGEHTDGVEAFWDAADIRIDDDRLQQGIRLNLFSIYQSAGRDGLRNIAAKGLSGEGYEGHYFWDTEVYVIPFFSYTFPEIAAGLLKYRYNILDKARDRAVVMSEKGALFPWRTINGEEASAYFPAGTAQYHINADIAYGLQKYEQVSGDSAFLSACGLEILIETARFWLSLGFFDDRSGLFRINCVTGPDEYTAIVNNNCFTNLMAKNNLLYAAEAVDRVRRSEPERFGELSERLSFSDAEAAEWLRAAEAMYLPYDSDLCIDAQDDTFLAKEKWDFSRPGMNRHPLLLHLHPLVIYRYQILKQPDVVLANFLLGESFSRIRKMRDYDYYNPITTGDSSLAPCIQSIMAAELGRTEEAYEYFMKTARMDLEDINSNVCDGVHIAAMGGTWLSLVYGFGGLRDREGCLSFTPRLPKAWDRLEFSLRYRGYTLRVKLNRETAVYSLSGAEGSLKIRHMGAIHTLRPGAPAEVSMKPELKGVIFDLDGVITDTSEFHYRAWNMLAEEKGYVFSREINERLRGIGRLESLDIILGESGVTLSREERFMQGELKNGYYKKLLETITPENILPGIGPLMAELRKRGIKTALASASRNAPTVVSRLRMEQDFDVIMDAAAIEKGKPDPEIFVSAAEAMDLLPEQCIGVEDAAAGVDAIRAAGMFSAGVGPAAEAADWNVPDTAGLVFEDLLQQFSGAR